VLYYCITVFQCSITLQYGIRVLYYSIVVLYYSIALQYYNTVLYYSAAVLYYSTVLQCCNIVLQYCIAVLQYSIKLLYYIIFIYRAITKTRTHNNEHLASYLLANSVITQFKLPAAIFKNVHTLSTQFVNCLVFSCDAGSKQQLLPCKTFTSYGYNNGEATCLLRCMN
jgi:hypothetical protein